MDSQIQFKYPTCGQEIFGPGKKDLQIQKYLDMCGQALSGQNFFSIPQIP